MGHHRTTANIMRIAVISLAVTAITVCSYALPADDESWEWVNDWETTGEIGLEVESVKIGGDSAASTYEEGSTFYRTFYANGKYERSNGAVMSFTLDTREPMSARNSDDGSSHFTFGLLKDGTDLRVGDVAPRLSDWTLRGKNIFGLTLSRQREKKGFQVVAGKYRNKPGTTPGDRYVASAGFNWSRKDRLKHTSEIVWTHNEDLYNTYSVKGGNRVWVNRLEYLMRSGQKVEAEYAVSRYEKRTDVLAPFSSGDALRIRGVFFVKGIYVNSTYENVDDGFVSLSGYSSAGRRIFLNQVYASLGKSARLSTGYSTNRTEAADFTSLPISISWKPFDNKNLSMIMDSRKQKAMESDGTSYNRSSGIRFRYKARRSVFTLGGKTDSYNSGESLTNTVLLDSRTSVSDNFIIKLRLARGKRRGEARLRNTYRAGIDWNLGHWTSFSLSQEIKNNIGHGRKRHTLKSSLRSYSPLKKHEVGMDYRYITYGTHKDHVFSTDASYYF